MRRFIWALLIIAEVVPGSAGAGTKTGWRWTTPWSPLAPGIELGIAVAPEWCKSGSPAIAVVRALPANSMFDVHHFHDEHLVEGLTISDWRIRTGAVLAVNAGQYDENLKHLGHLISDGRELGIGRHATFKGIFVAETGRDGRTRARILDLLTDKFNATAAKYACVLQSFMLFDHTGRKRVQDSGKLAARTILAQDYTGRIVIATSEGEYTLWDMASLLRGSDLNLKIAMSLDGGHAAQLSANGSDIHYDSSAARYLGRGDADPTLVYSPRLPAVLTITPLGQKKDGL